MKIICWISLIVAAIILIIVTTHPSDWGIKTTSNADYTHAAEIHDKDAKRLIDKIAEQEQLIGACKHRLSLYDDLFGG